MAASTDGVRNRPRRDLLRWALAVGGAGLTLAGLADLGVNGLESGAGVTSSGSSSSASQSYTPDYLDFLEWAQSVSDKIPNKSVTVSLEEEFAPYAVQQQNPGLQSYTGMTAGYDLLAYLTQLNSMVLALNTQSPSYDIFSIDNQNIGSFQGGIYSFTELAEKYPDLSYPNYSPGDFTAIALDSVGTYPPIPAGSSTTSSGGLNLCPFDSPVMILFYRKDVYDNLGFSPPATWDEYYSQCQKISGNGAQFACVNMANSDVSVVYEYLNHVASFGGSLWKIDGNDITPNFDSSENIDALENYVRFSDYADPGSVNFTWTDQFDSLTSGVSATAILWCDYYSWLSQPSYAHQWAGEFTPALNPAGPEGSFSTWGGSGLAVSKYSLHPEAAFVWMQWATCKGLQEETLTGSYHIIPTRASVPSTSVVETAVSGDTLDYAAYSIAQQALSTGGVTALTPFPQWLSVLTPLATQLNKAYSGAVSPAEALATAQTDVVTSFPNLTFASS